MSFRELHVHLMGIGGAGVSALVPLLQRAGAAVSGCDAHHSATVARLRDSGVPVAVGHDAAHVERADVVIHTAAVAADHPELVAARARGARVLVRGAALVELMRGYRVVAVAGSHGKTTTTWFLGHLLSESGIDPVVMVGGTVAALAGNARLGTGDWFVAEVDESDGSFAAVDAEVAIVTNLDREHLGHYRTPAEPGGSFSALEDAFNAWLRRVPAHGLIIVPAHGLSPRVTDGVRARVVRCGLDAGDWHARDLALEAEGSRARLIHGGQDAGELQVPIPGAHMVANALMACAAARHCAPAADLTPLARCQRVGRRFTVHGLVNGVRVVEDYGHHPAEIRATIAAARLAGGAVHVVFQPHRYSRTRDCFAEFTAAFDQAARVALLPVYGASESPIAGATSDALVLSLIHI
jgi:UDP-N-acetylmuramate--alanine ligase